MIARLLERIEAAEMSFGQAAAAFAGVALVRMFFENLSSPPPAFGGAFDALTLIHYFLFYIGVFLSLALVLRIFIPDIKRISKFLLFGFPIIWLSPIYDLIASHGAGARMAYAFVNYGSIANSFLAMGGTNPLGGITPGLHAELWAIVIGAGLYVFFKSKKIIRAIAAAAIVYMALFLWMIAPSLPAIVYQMATGSMVPSSLNFLIAWFSGSRSVQTFLRPTVQLSPAYAIGMTFNLGMGCLLYLLDIVLFASWLALADGRILKAIVRGCRPGRVAHYCVLFTIGILMQTLGAGTPLLGNTFDALVLAMLAIAFLLAFLYCVGVNNLSDVAIDEISNRNHPLVAGTLSAAEVQNTDQIFFFAALIGGYLAGYWEFFLIAVFMAAYYIYSAPPLRLKRIPILAPFLVSIACLSAALGGFYFADPNKLVADFSWQMAAIIIICFTLAINIKDIKDIEGDGAHGVTTIPVAFPRVGKSIVGGLLAAAFLAIPIILGSWALFIPSLIAGALGYYFVTAEPYREWRIFALYFCYAGVLLAVLAPR
ncbi:MAG TPA: UbiA family prenyltransferase [Candidatus Paceibacterota bacterium]|nr:UbiA family prenyltransferase [Candidatus Paceibacterota bacterium]